MKQTVLVNEFEGYTDAQVLDMFLKDVDLGAGANAEGTYFLVYVMPEWNDSNTPEIYCSYSSLAECQEAADFPNVIIKVGPAPTDSHIEEYLKLKIRDTFVGRSAEELQRRKLGYMDDGPGGQRWVWNRETLNAMSVKELQDLLMFIGSHE